MLIGALSLVIVVWLGTSMNCSRRSTFTGRSTIGIRNRRPGPRTRPSFGLAQPEDDHPLVLLDDPDRQVQDDQQDDDEERQDRQSDDQSMHAPREASADVRSTGVAGSTARSAVPSGAGSTISVRPSGRRRGPACRARAAALVGGPRAPLLAGQHRRSRSASSGAGPRRSCPAATPGADACRRAARMRRVRIARRARSGP